MTRRLHEWRQDDYNAFKFMRAVMRRRFAGSAWVPVPGRLPQRLTHANRDAAVEWFGEMALPAVQDMIVPGCEVVYVPIPGSGRVVGSLPSPSRTLAAELARRVDARLLDILRWRQPLGQMPRRRGPLDPQALSDNLITTGGVVMADCVLVADVVTGVACLQAVAGRLRRLGGRPVLVVSAGRTVDAFPDDPFAPCVQSIASFQPRDF
jgi:hypothetical protein